MADDKDATEIKLNALEGIDDVPKKKPIKKVIFIGVGLMALGLLGAAALMPSGGGGGEPSGRHDIAAGSNGQQTGAAPVTPPVAAAGTAQQPVSLDTPAPPPPVTASEPAGGAKMQVVEPPQKKVASADSSQKEDLSTNKIHEKKDMKSTSVQREQMKNQSSSTDSQAGKEKGLESKGVSAGARCQVRSKKKHFAVKSKKRIEAKPQISTEKTITPEATANGRPGYQLMFAN